MNAYAYIQITTQIYATMEILCVCSTYSCNKCELLQSNMYLENPAVISHLFLPHRVSSLQQCRSWHQHLIQINNSEWVDESFIERDSAFWSVLILLSTPVESWGDFVWAGGLVLTICYTAPPVSSALKARGEDGLRSLCLYLLTGVWGL